MKVRIGRVGLESKAVLEGDGKRDDEVHGAELTEHLLARVLVGALSSVNPEDAAEDLRRLDD